MSPVNELHDYRTYLQQGEKSTATVEKYIRDVCHFQTYLQDRPLCKTETIAYKEYLVSRYAPSSVNSMLASLNSFLHFIGKPDCIVKQLKVQRQIFCSETKALTLKEYQRLVKAAGNARISLVLQTICGTGIRVSELQAITVEAVREGKAVINCKNKTRVIFLPSSLQKLLSQYIKKAGLLAGAVFQTKRGKPLNRSNIWREMKALCRKADVLPEKVFPHNLRHLFARIFYGIEKDIVRLADLLGHSNINTTRIYTMDSGYQHMVKLEQIQKILAT